MYSMVLMAALTTGTDMPDMGRRGGCHGCSGGCYGGCYGGGYGGCSGGGWGGGYGGCHGGMAWGGCGGGSSMGWGGGGGYGGYAWGGTSPWTGGYAYAPMIYSGYAYAPMIYNYGTPTLASNTNMVNPGTQSFFYNPGMANEATLVVHLPADANLTVDGQPTRSTSGTRTFFSPPLEPGKTYTYTLRAEINRDGQIQNVKKDVEVQAGRPSEVTLDFGIRNREDESNRRRGPDEEAAPASPRRTPPRDREPNPPPRDR